MPPRRRARAAPADARGRWPRSRLSASSPPRTFPASETAGRCARLTLSSPTACGCCASTARATSAPTSWWGSTRAWTSCRRRSCAYCSPTSRAGPRLATPPAWPLYVVRHPRADELAAGLEAQGIGASSYYRRPVHLQPAMSGVGLAEAPLEGTEEAARTHLAIPMGAALDGTAVDAVVAAV